MLTVWGRRNSSNVQAVMWCIGELELPFRQLDVGHKYGGNDTPEFLAMNPNGTVPVLTDDDDAPIWESAAILRYLAARYGQGPFWPQEPRERAQIDKWAEWAKVNVAANFTVPIFWRLVRTAAKDRDHAAIASAVDFLSRKLDIAEAQLDRNTYIAGDDFSLADIVLGHLLYRYFDIDIDHPDHPNLRRYYDGLRRRPAFREHVMVSYEELRVA